MDYKSKLSNDEPLLAGPFGSHCNPNNCKFFYMINMGSRFLYDSKAAFKIISALPVLNENL